MLGAPDFLELSRAGRLDCDIWLVHLTGEEFPSDCMGAGIWPRLVEGSLHLRRSGDDRWISPGSGSKGFMCSTWSPTTATATRRLPDLARFRPPVARPGLSGPHGQSHHGTQGRRWNAPRRRRAASRPAERRRPPSPPSAPHPQLHGEVRPPDDPRSSLYNTDGQIFSDAGIPVVLFMENYDINRTGYHDTKTPWRTST